MTRLTPNEESWPLYQAIGTWIVAVGLLTYEGVVRHFTDSSGITLLGGLLGLPVIVNFQRIRSRDRERERSKDDDAHDTR